VSIQRGWKRWPSKERSSFLKKRSKKTFARAAGRGCPLAPNASRTWQKFFGSFFQKRTCLL
jgi:hypothetical protein